MEELAICATVKNEATYIHEWLSYHYAHGIRRFVLYNNSSTDDTVAVVERWDRSDTVTVVDWPHVNGQLDAYRDMVARFSQVAEWCAFIDCDEFLCPQANLSILDVLRQIGPEVNGLYVHWLMFGSSGHITRQPGLVTETFRLRAPDEFGSHYFGKSVMRLAAVTNVGGHVFRCHGRMVNDSGQEVDAQSVGAQTERSHRRLALNHYFTKSRDEWRQRRSLGRADKLDTDPDFRRPDHEFSLHDVNVVFDNRASLFMQAARAMFFEPGAPLSRPRFPSFGYLQTSHGTILCWDVKSSVMVHRSLQQLSFATIPVRYNILDEESSICNFTWLDNVIHFDHTTIAKVIFVTDNKAAFLCSKLFLCAEGNSSDIVLNRGEAGEWEVFSYVSPEYFKFCSL